MKSTSSSRKITLPLGMKQVCFTKFSIPVCLVCCINFLFMISRAINTGILVKMVLALKDTNVLPGSTFLFSQVFRLSLLTLTMANYYHNISEDFLSEILLILS